MSVSTWLDKITDETNPWLSAVKAEEGGDLETAAELFLGDAVSCLKKDSPVRSALSCYSAADCLMRAGAVEEAKRLFFEAGVMYTETADARLSSSIRESLWALQRAYACFVLADDIKEAETAREAYVLLARRANPFAQGAEGFQLPDLRRQSKPAPQGWVAARAGGPVKTAFDRFLAARNTARRPEGPRRIHRGPRNSEADHHGQESIVSQLG